MISPAINSRWIHTNGVVYQVVGYTNIDSDNPKYPETIVYQNVINHRMYSRPLSDWHRSMRLVNETEILSSISS